MLEDAARTVFTPAHLLALLLFVPVVTLIHEAGHALLARPAGFRLVSFGIGRGSPILRHRGEGGVIYYLGRWFLAGGACVAIPRSLATGPRAALFHAGGAIAQLVLALLLFALPSSWWWVEPVRSFNLLVMAWNLIPWRINGMASDGWWLLSALRSGSHGPGLLYPRRRQVERILDFEAEAGSPVGTWYARLMLAWMDLQVGRLDRADAFFTTEHAEAVLDPELDALHDALAAEWHRLRRRPLAALWVVRELRKARGTSLSTEADMLLSLVEARTWHDLDEPRKAEAALARLAGASGMVAADARVLRLELALGSGKPGEVEVAAWRLVEHNSKGFFSPAEAVHALWEAGIVIEEAGRVEAGRQVRRASRHLAGRLLAAALPKDRGELVRLLGEPAGVRPVGATA